MPKQLSSYAARLAKHPKHESTLGYWQRHEDAMTRPQGIERPIARMLQAWLIYADAYLERYHATSGGEQSGISDDGVLGLEWARIGAALRGLLNGNCGRIDCGAVDAVICDTLKDEGFDPDTL